MTTCEQSPLIDGDAGPWIPEHFEVAHQRGFGLGDRLANGFDDLGPGLIVGMDTPSAGRWFDDALAAIRVGEDAVGMTHDGGYWGIALATVDRAVFDGVPMSTERTGAIQLEQLDRIGRVVRTLPMVHDLDDFGDLAPIVRDLPGSRLAAAAANLLGPNWG